MAERKIILPTMDAEKVANEIGDFVIDIVKSHNKTGCVMGLSGGVDSTVVASLIKRAFDNTNYELVGYVLPSSVNNPKDAEDGINVAEKLGLRYYVRPIEEIVKGYRFTNPNAFTTDPKNKFHRGNMMSEIRAGVLHLEGALERKSVAGTGNKDEDFGIGYYTLFGDGAVHFSPIGGLSKRLVREMARYLGFNDLANREPDAGLEVGETDFKALGYSYDVVEIVTEGFSQGFVVDELNVHSQVVELCERDIVDYSNKFGFKKYLDVSEVVNDVHIRHLGARRKVQLVSPDSCSVGLVY